MFAKQIQKEVVVGPEIVVVRKLSGRSLQKARDNARSAQVQNVREIGPEMIRAFREEKAEAAAEQILEPIVEPTKEELLKARRASFLAYDQFTVLVAGVVSWTAKDKGKPVPVNVESLGELDEETSILLFEEILDLSVAPINAEEVSGKD